MMHDDNKDIDMNIKVHKKSLYIMFLLTIILNSEIWI